MYGELFLQVTIRW